MSNQIDHDRDQDELTRSFEAAVVNGLACADCGRWLDESSDGICRAQDCEGKSRWKLQDRARWEAGVREVLAPRIGELKGRRVHVRTNSDRAEEGLAVLQLMNVLTGVDKAEDAVADSICQLMHYCRMADIDFTDQLHSAVVNFTAEVDEDPDWPPY